MQAKNSKIALATTLDSKGSRTRRLCAFVLLGGVGTLIGCDMNDGRVKIEPWEARDEADSLATVSEAITITGTLFEDQFDTLNATTASPVGSGRKWYIQQNFKPNNEIQLYGNKVCPDNYDPPGNNSNLGTADNAAGVVTDFNNWSFCIVNDSVGGAGNALWLRAHNDGAGTIHSGRLNSKRLMEFAPTPSQGIKTTVRIRKYSASATHGGGFWPAVWFLQKDIAEAPVIGDGDNVNWPCERAHEIDLVEWGSLGGWGQAWGPTYNKSSMHYRNGWCIAQSVENTLGSEIITDSIANASYHTYAMELETTKARFYYDGVQYGPEHNVQGLKFDTPLFWLINAAAGGSLGGSVNWGAFNGDDKSLLIDYVKVETFNWSTALPRINIANTTDPNTATKLEAETNHAQSGMQPENCSEGGQNMGWIDVLPDGTGDWVQWDINVPAEADWKLEQRNAVNNGGAAAGFRIRVDGTQVASGNLSSTGGWQTWGTNSTNSFHLTAGNHTIQWQATTAGQNLNWVRLVKQTAASCNDYVKNQGEANIDCGGPCAACPTCSNGVKDSFDQLNWFESNVDCGGPCAACSGPGAGVGSTLQAESAHPGNQSGTQLENGNTTVGFFDQGDWLKFSGVNMSTLNGIRLRAAGANSGGVLQVRSGGLTGLILGEYTMQSTGGWATWAERDVVFTATDSWTSGDLYLIGKTGSGIMNLDSLTLLTKDNSGGNGNGFPVAIPNPGFAGGNTSGWSTFFNNGGSAAAAAGGSNFWGRITIPAVTNPAVRWHQQLYQTQVSDGGTYTLKAFFHGTSSAKTIDCFIEQNGGSYTNYALQSVTSTGSSNWVQCNVTSSAIPAGQSFKFGVRGGDTTATYDVDDFELINN